MIDGVSDFKKHKAKRRAEKLSKDIEAITAIMVKTQLEFVPYKHYPAVHEIISILETNKGILEMQKRKLLRELETT